MSEQPAGDDARIQPGRRRDPIELKTRRQLARRRTRAARLDVAIGVAVALVLIVFSPGAAITGLVAVLALLLLCAAFVLGRVRARRRHRRR